jgi:hypothetical protein
MSNSKKNYIIEKISIFNKSDKNISVTVVKYDNEDFTDIKPLPINSNSSLTWGRYLDRSYFCFLSESRVLYGFLCKAGVNYEYSGNGQMRLQNENRKYSIDFDVSPIKYSLKILAILEDVAISIFRDKELKSLVCTKLIKKNTDLTLSLPDGYYFLKIKDDECIYGVIPGKCYYIAKAQVLVGTKDNVIVRSHKDSDIKIELE